MPEVLPLEVFHGDVQAAVLGGAEVEHVDDVRVSDLGRGARLPAEALRDVRRPAIKRVQDFQRDPATDAFVLALVYPAQAASPAQPFDAVSSVVHGAGRALRIGRMLLVVEHRRLRRSARGRRTAGAQEQLLSPRVLLELTVWKQLA